MFKYASPISPTHIKPENEVAVSPLWRSITRLLSTAFLTWQTDVPQIPCYIVQCSFVCAGRSKAVRPLALSEGWWEAIFLIMLSSTYKICNRRRIQITRLPSPRYERSPGRNDRRLLTHRPRSSVLMSIIRNNFAPMYNKFLSTLSKNQVLASTTLVLSRTKDHWS